MKRTRSLYKGDLFSLYKDNLPWFSMSLEASWSDTYLFS